MQSQAAKVAAQTARRNQEIAAEMARRAMDEGQEEEALHRIRIGLFMGKQRVAAAAAGAVVDRDSPLILVEDAAAMGELDVHKIRNKTAATVWGYETQQSQFEMEEEMATFQGRMLPAMTLVSGAAQTAGIFSAGSGGGKSPLSMTKEQQKYLDLHPSAIR
jgi:hypothetical protein